jgi:hypothetical protein
MLLFNEDLGIGGNSLHGSEGIGNDFEGLGAFFFSQYFSQKFIEVLKLSTTIAYARTQRSMGRSKSLGTELDLGFDYLWKENLETGLKMGFFFPGKYFEGRKTGFGLMATVAFEF